MVWSAEPSPDLFSSGSVHRTSLSFACTCAKLISTSLSPLAHPSVPRSEGCSIPLLPVLSSLLWTAIPPAPWGAPKHSAWFSALHSLTTHNSPLSRSPLLFPVHSRGNPWEWLLPWPRAHIVSSQGLGTQSPKSCRGAPEPAPHPQPRPQLSNSL